MCHYETVNNSRNYDQNTPSKTSPFYLSKKKVATHAGCPGQKVIQVSYRASKIIIIIQGCNTKPL